MREIRAWTRRRGLHDRIAGNLVVILGEVTQQGDRDEVQHDRVDDFMRSELRFQQTWNASPNRARDDCRDAT